MDSDFVSNIPFVLPSASHLVSPLSAFLLSKAVVLLTYLRASIPHILADGGFLFFFSDGGFKHVRPRHC